MSLTMMSDDRPPCPEIGAKTSIDQIRQLGSLADEFLYPFDTSGDMTLGQYCAQSRLAVDSMIEGLNRAARKQQFAAPQAQLYRRLIKPGYINVAVFSHFTWHEPLIDFIQQQAKRLEIALNLQVFSKRNKIELQAYLAACEQADQLPDMLIGKGFSSLMSARFQALFVQTGVFKQRIDTEPTHPWQDPRHSYHLLALDPLERVSHIDSATSEKQQQLWVAGRPDKQHMNFALLLERYLQGGESAVRRQFEQVTGFLHFSQIVEQLVRHDHHADPRCYIMRRYSRLFVPSRYREQLDIDHLQGGAPCSAVYMLVKSNANESLLALAESLYLPDMQPHWTKAGLVDIGSAAQEAQRYRFPKWEALYDLPLPWLKARLAGLGGC
ncbi:ABC transporter substrate-binding protein [Vibrio sp. WXL103]|uniref:ABC transporter substrate-binding protein n=1 Tax=Vibrio sp. WXL103 TaxID=3450710 RepID=UPI003EC78020